MTKKILIIGTGVDDKKDLLLHTIKEKYSSNGVLVTLEEAKELDFKSEDFIKSPIIMEEPLSGKESRRKRREQERKENKKNLK